MEVAHLHPDLYPVSPHQPHTMPLTLHLADLGDKKRQMSRPSSVAVTHGTL